MGHPRDTLYAPTHLHRNVRNTRSAIPAISVTISAISVTISAIPVAISATSAISAIFAIPETSASPAPSTCWPSNQVPDIYPFFPYTTSWLYHTVHVHSLIISTLLHIIATRTHSVTDNTGTSTALYLADTLVKHKQANPYTDGYSKRWQDIGFPLPGVSPGKAFFLYTREVFASKWALGGFSL